MKLFLIRLSIIIIINYFLLLQDGYRLIQYVSSLVPPSSFSYNNNRRHTLSSSSMEYTSSSRKLIKTTTFITHDHRNNQNQKQYDDDCIVKLYSKKNSGNSKLAAPTKKIQVKLLKYIQDIGNVGDIVQVTPAFFDNKLRPQKSAAKVTDEEIEKERIRIELLDKERDAVAIKIKEYLNNQSIIINRKAGPDGHLFGSIGPKIIMDDVVKMLHNNDNNDEYKVLDQKRLKLVSIHDNNNDNVIELKTDIKYIGDYEIKISLTKDIDATLKVKVQPE